MEVKKTFFGDDTSLFGESVSYELVPSLVGKSGEEIAGKTHYDKWTKKYHILINENLIESRSVLEIATTILHESVHALLMSQINNTPKAFEEIFKEYIKNKTGKDDISHPIMEKEYIIPIANILKQIDVNKESDFDFYKSIASEGIKKNLTDEERAKLSSAKAKAREKGLNCN